MENNENNINQTPEQNVVESKKKNNKKILIPTIVAIVTLGILVVGATYAYITVTATSNFGSPTIKGTVPSIGSVTMNAGTSLTLTTTRQGMMDENPATYYATSSGISTTASGMQTIATATVSGEGTFTCTYNLNVKGTGTLLTNSKGLGAGLVTLEVTYGTNGGSTQTYDFNSDLNASGNVLNASGATLSGTFTGLTSSQSRTITARFKLANSATANQTALNGTNGTITFTVNNFACTATG